MPLCLSSHSQGRFVEVELSDEQVDLACDVALDTSDGFASAVTLRDAPVEVVAGALLAACAGQGDVVQGGSWRGGRRRG
jgi:hypothetical protein